MVLLLRDLASRHSVAIRTELAAGLPPTTADRVQLQQVSMNLMLNGIEAMQEYWWRTDRRVEQERERRTIDFGDRFGSRVVHRRYRAHLRGILHHEAARHPHGALDQSADHRVAWRPSVGEPQHWPGRNFSVHVAASLMTLPSVIERQTSQDAWTARRAPLLVGQPCSLSTGVLRGRMPAPWEDPSCRETGPTH